MRLYRLLARLLRVIVYLYFAEVRVLGRRNMPARGPVLIAANHPSSVLDGIVLGTQLPRPIHYLIRASLFRHRPLAALFRAVGAIPVYRRNESADAATRNVDVFVRVYELFERGGCVGIFPEGRNSPPHGVAPLRTGAARMALGAEARNDWRLDLAIVPAGITFVSRELLMATVLVRLGPAIRVADYAADYRADPEAAAQRLTADLQAALERETLQIEDQQVAELSDDLAHFLAPEQAGKAPVDDEPVRRRPLLKRWLWALLARYRPRGPGSAGFAAHVHDRRRIGEVLARAERRAPGTVAALRRQVDRYRDHLSQTELRRELDAGLDQPARRRWLWLRMTVYALVMAPVAAFGLAHNAVPYFITRWLGRLYRDEPTRAFAYFGFGLLAFLVTYGGLGVWLSQAGGWPWPWIVGYLALLPPTGLAALGYRRTLLIYRGRILVRGFVWNRREMAELLRRERAAIAERFRTLAAAQG